MTNRERASETTSSLRVGRCAISTFSFLSTGDRYLTPRDAAGLGIPAGRWCLCPRHQPSCAPPPGRARHDRAAGWGRAASVLGVELDDQLLGEDGVDLCPGRQLVHQHLQRAGDDLQPRRHRAVADGLASQLDRERLGRLGPHLDDVVLRDAEGRHVDPLAVDQEVAVGHELASGTTGAREAGTVDHVVQAGLEDLQQRLTRLAGTAGGLGVVTAELLLHDAVGEAGLLLLLELVQVLLLLHPATAVLAGRERATLEVLVVADEVDLEPTRLLGDGSGVTSHVLSLPRIRRGGAWAGARRCAAWA